MLWGFLKLLLKIVAAPVVIVLTLAIWICVGLVYVSGLVLGLISMVLALLGVIVLATYSPQNGVIVLILAFLISPFGLPKLALWLLGQIQNLKFAVQDLARKVYETDGKYIDEVQKNILAISRTEEPYDIFICYKETLPSRSMCCWSRRIPGVLSGKVNETVRRVDEL